MPESARPSCKRFRTNEPMKVVLHAWKKKQKWSHTEIRFYTYTLNFKLMLFFLFSHNFLELIDGAIAVGLPAGINLFNTRYEYGSV